MKYENCTNLSNEEIRLLRAFNKMTPEKQNDLMEYLQNLLHTQEHAHDAADYSA